jgi:hypothetical protein
MKKIREGLIDGFKNEISRLLEEFQPVRGSFDEWPFRATLFQLSQIWHHAGKLDTRLSISDCEMLTKACSTAMKSSSAFANLLSLSLC